MYLFLDKLFVNLPEQFGLDEFQLKQWNSQPQAAWCYTAFIFYFGG